MYFKPLIIKLILILTSILSSINTIYSLTMSSHLEPPNIRKRIAYTSNEEQVLSLSTNIALMQMQMLDITKHSIIHPEQSLAATQIYALVKDPKIVNTAVIGKTQSGKTGTMIALLKTYLYDRLNLIPIENVYIITGDSSKQWKEQTKERFPDSMRNRIYHRSDLSRRFVDEVKGKQNVIIIMDEVQIAAGDQQTVAKIFKDAGFYDRNYLFDNDIKIVEFSATPDGTLYQLSKWNSGAAQICIPPPPSYTGAYDLLNQKRVYQCKDLCGYDKQTNITHDSAYQNIEELKEVIDQYTQPLYHIVRTHNGYLADVTRDNIATVFENSEYHIITFDADNKDRDINHILEKIPDKHTLILIKEMLRCAKTICKTHIGVLYERQSLSPGDSSIIQGLIGRMTGYCDNGLSVCFTNIDSIERYEQLFNTNFTDDSIPWKSNTTTSGNGKTKPKTTFNDPKKFHLCVKSPDAKSEPVIQKFPSQESMKNFFVTRLKRILGNGKCNGPRQVKPNSFGMYECTIRSKKRVYDTDTIYSERFHGLDNTNYRFYPCYRDPSDSSTLEFWLIYHSP